MRSSLLAGVVAFALVAPATTPATARAQATTLDFDAVPTFAAQGHTGPLALLQGYEFFNFRVMSTSEAFGSGANASSGARFAYGGAGLSSASIYRSDVAFTLTSAFLSFRTYDGSTLPGSVVVRGWRGSGPLPAFERTLTLGNTAERFDFDFRAIEEVEFDFTALQAGRAAVLAVDDVALATVPEPATVTLVAGGLVLVVGAGWRRRAAATRA